MRLPPGVRRATLLPLLALFAFALALAGSSQPAQAVSTTVVISQAYGGGGNSGAPYKNDFVELFNRGATTVSLSGWSVQYASATGMGNFGSNLIATLSGSLAPGQYYLVQVASGGANGVALPTPDATGTVNMGSTGGKVALVNTTTGLACNGGSTPCTATQLAQIIDLVGWDGANFFEGSGPASATTSVTAVVRKDSGCTDTDINSDDFTALAPAPRNTLSALNPCVAPDAPPTVTSTYPANGATDVAVNTNLAVTFSEPVTVTDPWFTLSCSVSGAKTAVASGGPTTFSLDPTTDFVGGETCTLTIVAVNVKDQDNNDPPDAMTANFSVGFSTVDVCTLPYTPIPAIQGSGATVAISGGVTTQGVVIGDYEGPSPALRGFFIQDPLGDGNPATSDGIFVFEGSNANTVSLGDVVRVTGTAGENQGQSQISVGTIVKCGVGTVMPTDVTLPFAAADAAERYEGMLVRLPQTLYVTEHFQLGRFGQVVLSSGGRLRQPTDQVAPGAPANALQAQNNLDRIILDDASQAQNPDPILFGRGGLPLSASNTLRGGDTATGIVGVMTYTWAGNAASGNAYRVRPINALGGGVPDFQPANPRPATAPNVGGDLKVVGMNLLNYFNTFDGAATNGCNLGVGGAPTDCRGADDAGEFDRQWPKTVAAILGTGADIVGLVELENDGYGPTSAIQDVVSKLNAATAPGTWAFIDADAATGQVNALGTDAIRVAFIYKPARVTPVGQTAALNSVAFVNGGDSAPRNRASLAQAFEQVADGARLIVNVNHLKSKGSACDAADAGDGQGNCNTVRTNAANELVSWLATNPTGTGETDVLIVGDLNSYAKEDPITAFASGGLANLVASRIGPDAYSYVFDGQWGYLDYALGSASLATKVSGVGEWHINADEPSV
ncbi:MAG: ExeM/NucH family extracellular endonuclease, partial [Anaerolineae bacterium]|nr:ExeM/NucH family extracellular endonuclease [Anaerolineae bacterium]